MSPVRDISIRLHAATQALQQDIRVSSLDIEKFIIKNDSKLERRLNSVSNSVLYGVRLG